MGGNFLGFWRSVLPRFRGVGSSAEDVLFPFFAFHEFLLLFLWNFTSLFGVLSSLLPGSRFSSCLPFLVRFSLSLPFSLRFWLAPVFSVYLSWAVRPGCCLCRALSKRRCFTFTTRLFSNENSTIGRRSAPNISGFLLVARRTAKASLWLVNSTKPYPIERPRPELSTRSLLQIISTFLTNAFRPATLLKISLSRLSSTLRARFRTQSLKPKSRNISFLPRSKQTRWVVCWVQVDFHWRVFGHAH